MKVTEVKVIERKLRYDGHRNSNKNWRHFNKPPMVFVLPEGQTIFDDMTKRKVRPHTLYRKYALEPALKAIGFSVDDCVARWSQTAGCPCGCSPGFRLQSSIRQLPKVDIYVTVEGSDAHMAEGKEPRELHIPTRDGIVVPTNSNELVDALLNV